MKTIRSAAAAGLALTAATTLAVGAPSVPGAEAATPTCHGRAATIVGDGDFSTVQGTPGDDVIVTNGAEHTYSNGGHDLICVTGIHGGTAGQLLVYVVGGTDTLTVDASASRSQVDVTAGPGSHVVGSPYDDDIRIASAAGRPAVVDSGAGDDAVTLGLPIGGVRAAELDDAVSLGTGNDRVTLDAPVGSGSLSAGPGFDTLGQADDHPDAWKVDFARRTVSTGAATEPMTAFEGLEAEGSWSSLDVTGSPADERVLIDDYHSANADGGSEGPFTVRLGGGDDVLEAARGVAGTLDGGPGRNRFVSVHAGGRGRALTRVTVRLPQGTAVGGGGTVHLRSIQDVSVVDATRATVVGDGGPNRINVISCVADLSGHAGADVVRYSTRLASSLCPTGLPRTRGHLDGGLGDDPLIGSGSRDDIVGGAGHDVAIGGGGQDTCSAERVRAC